MIVKTFHKYVSIYPIKRTDKSLILGTIHPHNTENFKVDFFYGNKNSLWDILTLVKDIELNCLLNITNFLSNNNIGISDMILECSRENYKITADKYLYDLVLNEKLKDEILNSDIQTIYFTSAFNKNNAAKLFFDLFKLNIPSNWKETYEININFYGKSIKCIILLSPSGAANIGISKNKLYLSKKDFYLKNFEKPVKQFKIDFYKEKFRI